MFENHPEIQFVLNERNQHLSKFWFSDPQKRIEPVSTGLKILMIDAEDTFTIMLSQQLSALGHFVSICSHSECTSLDKSWDLVVMGPGPGDPRNQKDKRIVNIRTIFDQILYEDHPFLAICLSHQILCLTLGLDIIRREAPNQGVQREISLFGEKEKVGFYNTYVAQYDAAHAPVLNQKNIEFSWDEASKEIHAIRSSNFVSLQFHPESILTTNGINIITSCIKRILKI